MTSIEQTKNALKKIQENAHLKAVIEINPDALEIAAQRDGNPDKSGVLHGIPVLVKDNVNTGDKMHTTAGALAMAENKADKDAPSITNLRDAGAVIIGKANMTEYANYMCDFRLNERMPNGYSSRGGQTLHPLGSHVDPSGSSTGSAVAVAAGLVDMAVGSETYGSIISPSQLCGVVGLKPTDGLVSKEGVIPISFTLDTLGPITSSVQGAADLLSGLTGKEYKMAAKLAVVGVCHLGADETHDWYKAQVELVENMKAAGMTVKDLSDDSIAKWAKPGTDFFIFPIMEYEFKHAINSYLATSNNPHKTLDQLIDFNEANKEIALKYGQGNLIKAAEKTDNWKNEPEYVKALSERELAQKTLDKYFDDNGIDVLLMMSANCAIAAGLGFPSLTMPLGKTSAGLPIGCLLMARRFDEDMLLATAKTVEKGR